MSFLILLVALAIAYLVWRIVDQLPDIVYRLSEIQRDIADIRRRLEAPDANADSGDDDPSAAESEPSP